MIEMHEAWYESPIGRLRILGNGRSILRVDFVGAAEAPSARREWGRAEIRRGAPSHLADCARQLDEYFRGGRREFSLRLELEGSGFQRLVWKALAGIPYGQTRTYGNIAAALGNPAASRAVGGANHRNPVSIIVPCHRVVGCAGRLTGYGGGLWRKAWLLEHEAGHSGDSAPRPGY